MKINDQFDDDGKPGKVLSYDEFLALYHKGQVAGAIIDGKLKPKSSDPLADFKALNTKTATTNPAHSGWMKPIVVMRDRLAPYGVWDEANLRPMFGWAPVLFGWVICIRETSSSTPEVAINGTSWSPADGLIPWGDSKWAAAA